MAINKVIYGGDVLIDLTGDTVTADKLAKGVTAHDASGATITGTNTYDADTQDATAAVAEILTGKTAYVRGKKITGTMKNNGGVKGTITTRSGSYTAVSYTHLDVYKRQGQRGAEGTVIAQGESPLFSFNGKHCDDFDVTFLPSAYPFIPVQSIPCLLYTSRCV